MRVLQVVSLLTPDGAFGGPARVALNQAAELRRQGHDVTLAAGSRGLSPGTTEVDGVPVRLFRARTILPKAGFPGIGAPGLWRWFASNGTDFDIVHIHFGRDLVVLPIAVLALRKGIRCVLQTHGMVVPSAHPLVRPLDALWTRRLLRDAGAVLYLTDLERDQLGVVARGPIRLEQLGNGVPEYSRRLVSSGRPEVLFLARMHARKRPLMFVEMARKLLSEGIDAQFTLIGPDEGEGESVRAAVGNVARIRWEGALPPCGVPIRMAKANIYVLPAECEPYPMSVLEAMSVGLPVVVADDCGLATLVRESGCGLVAAGGVQAFTDAVRALLADRRRADDMGGLGRRAVHDVFGMQAIGHQLAELYDDVSG